MKLWTKFVAFFRLSPKAICEASIGLGDFDYHDYMDGVDKHPWHMHRHKCVRCGKEFRI